jgi:STE24 endopeptidase
MTWGRAAALLVGFALGAALLFAAASRAPARVRAAEPGPGALDPELGNRFSDEQIARSGAYRRGAYAGWAIGLVLQVATLIVLARGPVASAASALERWNLHWLVRHTAVALLVVGMLLLATAPLGYVGLRNGHAWGLSTQGTVGWIADRARAFLIAGVVAALAAAAFFGAVRLQPRSWWLWAWLAFSALTVLLAFVWPLVVAPLFNRFDPLEPGPLRRRVIALADAAGIHVGGVFVVDASKRSTVENAYVAGWGGSRRLVLYDTLVEGFDEDEAAFVVAHELGHQAENHVLKNVVVTIAGMFVGFAVLALIASRPGVWSWAGAAGIGDVRALPLLLLLAIGANTITLPIENAISRRFEARADAIALDLTDAPETAVGVFRRLAFSNLSDLRPPSIAVWALFTHPPIRERIVSALEHRAP